MMRFRLAPRASARLALLCLLPLLPALPAPAAAAAEAIGDTLTVIQRPLLNIPAILTPGRTLTISCAADPATTGWQAEIRHGSLATPLPVTAAVYDAATTWWELTTTVPADTPFELYDLRVTADGGLDDTTRHAVRVIPAFRTSWYFVQVTDPHLPTHMYYYENGAETDSTEMEDLRAVIEDLGVINPEFVLLTGDLVNEGELEDYLTRRYYTRAQRLLAESEVPIYLTAGNHDLGGWSDTPPSDGTARRDWWRFFGWKRLDSPPPGAPARTQDYSFDYDRLHFVGLEGYINYDRWRSSIYGSESFTADQLAWLHADLDAASGSVAQVLFTHSDFGNQINLSSLGLEMMLTGHIHRDDGSITSAPYDLATDNTCDGNRSWRLVRVEGDQLLPRPTLSAGSSGQNLRVLWSPANDGGRDSVTAQVVNGYGERFQNGLLKFRLAKHDGGRYLASGGILLQVDASGSEAVCYVEVDIAASATTTATAWFEPASGAATAPPAVPLLDQNRPNPFNPRTELSYTLPRDALVRLAVHDARGREVAVLAEGPRPAGAHRLDWDGRDRQGRELPSGVYFLRLTADGRDRVRKMVLAR